MKKILLCILFVVVAFLGLTGTSPAVASPAPTHEARVAPKIAAPGGSDCWGWTTAAKQASGKVRVTWEIYCSQQYYPFINLAPVLVRGNNTTYYQKPCRDNNGVNDCFFSDTVNNPAGLQDWWVTWDPSPHGSGVYWGSGEKRCTPAGIHCADTRVRW